MPGHARGEGLTSMANTNQVGCIRRVRSFHINVALRRQPEKELVSSIPGENSLLPLSDRSERERISRVLFPHPSRGGTTINRIYFNYSRADDDICYVSRARESLGRILCGEGAKFAKFLANEGNGIPSRSWNHAPSVRLPQSCTRGAHYARSLTTLFLPT